MTGLNPIQQAHLIKSQMGSVEGSKYIANIILITKSLESEELKLYWLHVNKNFKK